MHFTSYIVFLAIALGGFFIARRFFKEEHLFFVAALFFVLSIFSPDFAIGGYAISMNVVFVPLLLACMLVCYRNDADRTKKLFFQMLIVLSAVFVVYLVQSIFFACQGYGPVSWGDISPFAALAVSLTTAMFVGKVLDSKFPQNNYVFKSLFLAMLAAIDAAIYVILKFVFIDGVQAKDVLFCMVISLIFVAATAFAVTLVDYMLLPASLKKPAAPKAEAEEAPTAEEAPASEEPVEEQPAEELPASEEAVEEPAEEDQAEQAEEQQEPDAE